MTSRERMLTAMAGKQPDRIPCSPDISNMIPCRLTGKPFWDILYYQNPPLWQVYLDACEYFDIDSFFFHASTGRNPRAQFSVKSKVIRKDVDRVVTEKTFTTPAGDFTEEWTFPKADSETCTRKAFDTIKEALPKLKYVLSDDIDGTDEEIKMMRKILGEKHALGGYCNSPMLPYHWLHGQLEEAVAEYFTEFDTIAEYRELFKNYNVRRAQLLIDFGVDFILIESSGSITMQSPDIFKTLQLETLQIISKMCREAGVISVFHSCGKTLPLLEDIVENTDIDCIQPLECPPTGDIDLAETKKKYGDKIALMGNLNTPQLMLRGTEEDVYNAARHTIEVAGKGGGFVLSTGDQCGRDTPEANIRAMRRAVEV
jgi:uroporphyrinogen decarboxylase